MDADRLGPTSERVRAGLLATVLAVIQEEPVGFLRRKPLWEERTAEVVTAFADALGALRSARQSAEAGDWTGPSAANVSAGTRSLIERAKTLRSAWMRDATDGPEGKGGRDVQANAYAIAGALAEIIVTMEDALSRPVASDELRRAVLDFAEVAEQAAAAQIGLLLEIPVSARVSEGLAEKYRSLVGEVNQEAIQARYGPALEELKAALRRG